MTTGSRRPEFTRVTLPHGAFKVFVFGSNLAGVHGKGAALFAAKHYGAKRGLAYGLSGRSFAIPTRDRRLVTLPLTDIADYVAKFLAFAARTIECEFFVTQIGCGYAGYEPSQIAPMFANAPGNVVLPPEFQTDLFSPTPERTTQETTDPAVAPGDRKEESND